MYYNPELVNFLLVTAFSFLIGLEVKSYRSQYNQPKNQNYFFGDVRTYSFVGILGFVLYSIESPGDIVYIAGLFALTLLYALLYYRNLLEGKRSILLFIVMLLVYSFGAFIQREALWMSALLYVSIVFILNSTKDIEKYIKNINMEEFETLGKMILLSAVVLPLLPDTKTIPYIPLSPFKIWLAVVVISGISYGGYIVQKYFFPSKGYFLTGIFGGSYSSTATTVVLARKAKQIGGLNVIDAAIISATSVMYLRLIVVALLFNFEIGRMLFVPFFALAFSGFVVSAFYLKNPIVKKEHPDIVDSNPLELKTAFIFAFLFVAMMILTQYVTQDYGKAGLEILSFIVGFTDIDPFVLSILTGKFSVSSVEIVAAIMIASGSNNLLKAIYAVWFGGFKNAYRSAIWIAILGIVTIVLGLSYENII